MAPSSFPGELHGVDAERLTENLLPIRHERNHPLRGRPVAEARPRVQLWHE